MTLLDYAPLITKVSRQTAFRTNASYGYRIVTPEDIEAEVYVRLLENGTDLDEVETPEAWLRTTAKYSALQMAESVIRPKHRDENGERKGTTFPIDTYEEAFEDRTARSILPWQPERALDFEAKVQECSEVIEGILQKVDSPRGRDALRSYYLDAEGGSGAERVARHRAEKKLLPEDLASLRVWRAWLFPEALNYPPETEATPLLAVLLS